MDKFSEKDTFYLLELEKLLRKNCWTKKKPYRTVNSVGTPIYFGIWTLSKIIDTARPLAKIFLSFMHTNEKQLAIFIISKLL